MSKVVIDESLRARLNGLNAQMEFCDEAGRTLGHFVPTELYRKLVYAWANAQVTDEELRRAVQEPGGRSLAAIWKRLGMRVGCSHGL